MIEVKQVTTPKQRKQFLRFPLRLYKNCKYFVPPLNVDEKRIFRSDYMYCDQAEAVYFNAYLDGKMAGRISGILQHAANKKWGQKRVRFTRFDCIDDLDVARALFDAVESWARQKGMTEVAGPLGFSDLEREGLLVEGFDCLSTFEEQYNYPYYQRLIEQCGYVKDVDWLEHKLRAPQGLDPKIERISNHMMQRYNLHFGQAKNSDEFLKKYADGIFRVWDETYDGIYGTVPFTEKMKKSIVESFRMIVDTRFVSVILDEKEQMVAFGVAFPSIADAVRRSRGRLTPLCLLRIMRSVKHPKVLELGVIGVTDQYKNKAISTALIAKIGKDIVRKISHAETNLTLEYNDRINNLWKLFEAERHKRRRCYVKKL